MTQEMFDGLGWDEFRTAQYAMQQPCLGYIGWSTTLEHNRGWSPIKVGMTADRRTYELRKKQHYRAGFTVVGNWSWTVAGEKAFHDQWRRFIDDYPGRGSGYRKETYKPHVEIIHELTDMLLDLDLEGLVMREHGWHVDEIVDRLRGISRGWHRDPSEDR